MSETDRRTQREREVGGLNIKVSPKQLINFSPGDLISLCYGYYCRNPGAVGRGWVRFGTASREQKIIR